MEIVAGITIFVSLFFLFKPKREKATVEIRLIKL